MSHKATNWAVTVRGISCAEARVLFHLSDCHNPVEGCFPSQEYLADACEIDERSVRRHLISLRSKGHINWTERRNGKYRENNRYSLAFETGFRAADPDDLPDNLSGSNIETSTGQNEQFEPDNSDVLNRTMESSKEKPVIEPVILTEREGACAGSTEDPKKIEREFLRWWPSWPTYPNGSENATRRAWYELTPAQRAACISKTPAFIAAVKASKGGSFTFPAVYLNERAWERLEDPKDEIAPPTMHKAFSRPWTALFLAEISKPMSTSGWPALTMFQRNQIRDPEEARKLERERKAKYGWPKASAMVTDGKAVSVPPKLVAMSESFERMRRGDERYLRWQALHERMGWPWFPDADHEWFHFPAGEPEEAMAEFQARLSEGKGDVDAA
jgi:hypothetical protein|nr:helix-turn-helix domain-containing protein [Neorhizobium tomejilense]